MEAASRFSWPSGTWVKERLTLVVWLVEQIKGIPSYASIFSPARLVSHDRILCGPRETESLLKSGGMSAEPVTLSSPELAMFPIDLSRFSVEQQIVRLGGNPLSLDSGGPMRWIMPLRSVLKT